MTKHILRLDASVRSSNSVSRDLTDQIVSRFTDAEVTVRDLAGGLPLIDEAWVGANFTAPDDRTEAQKEALRLSDELIEELQTVDTLVIGLPIYNFGVPANLKAWIDLVARAGVTFRYTETGPEGLLKGKRAIIAFASGGTETGSSIDFASGYLRHILSFIGITDVEFVSADRMMVDAEATMQKAKAQIAALDVAA